MVEMNMKRQVKVNHNHKHNLEDKEKKKNTKKKNMVTKDQLLLQVNKCLQKDHKIIKMIISMAPIMEILRWVHQSKRLKNSHSNYKNKLKM